MKNILQKIQDASLTFVELAGVRWRIRRVASLDMIQQGEGLLSALPPPDEDRVEVSAIEEMPEGEEKTARFLGFQQRKMRESLGRIGEIVEWQEAVIIEGVVAVADLGSEDWQPTKFVRGVAKDFVEGDAFAEIPFTTLSLAERSQLTQIIIDHSNGGADAMARVARFRGGS